MTDIKKVKKPNLFATRNHYLIRYPDQFGLLAFEHGNILSGYFESELNGFFRGGVRELVTYMCEKHYVHNESFKIAFSLLILTGCLEFTSYIDKRGKEKPAIQLKRPLNFDPAIYKLNRL